MGTRRQRTVFHYKVDEMLRQEDREAYAAVVLDPRTTNESAHAWLTARGYALSLSAVARHRRRRVAADRARRADLDRLQLVARHTGDDLAAGAEALFQHLVFEHLIRINERAPSPFAEDVDDDDDDDGGSAADDIPDEDNPVTSAELLRMSKLVAACVKLTEARVRARVGRPRTDDADRDDAPAAPSPPRDEAAAQAELIARIAEVLDVRPPPGLPTRKT